MSIHQKQMSLLANGKNPGLLAQPEEDVMEIQSKCFIAEECIPLIRDTKEEIIQIVDFFKKLPKASCPSSTHCAASIFDAYLGLDLKSIDSSDQKSYVIFRRVFEELKKNVIAHWEFDNTLHRTREEADKHVLSIERSYNVFGIKSVLFQFISAPDSLSPQCLASTYTVERIVQVYVPTAFLDPNHVQKLSGFCIEDVIEIIDHQTPRDQIHETATSTVLHELCHLSDSEVVDIALVGKKRELKYCYSDELCRELTKYSKYRPRNKNSPSRARTHSQDPICSIQPLRMQVKLGYGKKAQEVGCSTERGGPVYNAESWARVLCSIYLADRLPLIDFASPQAPGKSIAQAASSTQRLNDKIAAKAEKARRLETEQTLRRRSQGVVFDQATTTEGLNTSTRRQVKRTRTYGGRMRK